MNSRQLAQKWSFPKHKIFEKELRKAASNWFKTKDYETHPRISYCPENWSDWKSNIILDEVSCYIEKVKDDREREGKPFPLHKYIHHGLSSQVMAFNLICPLITRNDYESLISVLQSKNFRSANDIHAALFEYEDRDVFNEGSGQPA